MEPSRSVVLNPDYTLESPHMLEKAKTKNKQNQKKKKKKSPGPGLGQNINIWWGGGLKNENHHSVSFSRAI